MPTIRWPTKKRKQTVDRLPGCHVSQNWTEFLFRLGFFIFSQKYKQSVEKWQWGPRWILIPPPGHLRSEQTGSTEVASGKSQLSNKAGDRGSACAGTGEMEAFVFRPVGLQGEQRKWLGRGVSIESLHQWGGCTECFKMGLQDNDICVRGSDSVVTLTHISCWPLWKVSSPAWHSHWCLGQYMETQGPEEGQSVGSSSEGSRFLTHALRWTAKNYSTWGNPAGMVVTQGQI